MDSPVKLEIQVAARDLASGVLLDIGNAAVLQGQRATRAFNHIGDAIESVSGKLLGLHGSFQSLGGRMLGLAEQPATAFTRMDSALASLTLSLLDRSGKVGEGLALIRDKAVALGRALPGGEVDMLLAGKALIDQGMVYQEVVAGGLEASAKLGAVLREPPQEAAKLVSLLQELYGLLVDDLPNGVNILQQASFAFGKKPGELEGMLTLPSDVGSGLNINGLSELKSLLSLQDSIAKYSGGGAVKNLLVEILNAKDSLVPGGMGVHKANMALAKHGVTLKFFSENGGFLGIDNLARQLGKLKSVEGAERKRVLEALFGRGGAPAAEAIATAGVAGYQASLDKLDKQALLQDRLSVIQKETLNLWKSLNESISTTLSLLAGPSIKEWGELFGQALQGKSEKMGDWVKEHPATAKWGFGLLAGAAVAVSGLGALGLLLTAVVRGLSVFKGAFDGIFKLFGGKGKGVAGRVLTALHVQKVFITNWPAGGLGGSSGVEWGDGKPNGRNEKPKPRIRLKPGALSTGSAGMLPRRGASGVVGKMVSGGVALAAGAGSLLKSGGGAALKLLGRVPLLAVGMAGAEAWAISRNAELTQQQKDQAHAGVAGGLTGSVAGGLAGMAAGAALGSVVPVIGTAIGGVIGGLIGSMGGDMGGRWLGGAIHDAVSSSRNPPVVARPTVGGGLSGASPQAGGTSGYPAAALTAAGHAQKGAGASVAMASVSLPPARQLAAAEVASKPLAKSHAPVPEVKVHYAPALTIHGDVIPGQMETFRKLLEANARLVGEIVRQQTVQQQRGAL
ncbi:phage tail tape measure protein [Chromobacterium subtsugae]|uniref:phage tail tape measure protein n=1 Tax=Chromobacterium subtsugae TaxID=251747 RepID=UPI0006412B73|nr:phage tail tape measure protein [Chromobacterium subtsugae]